MKKLIKKKATMPNRKIIQFKMNNKRLMGEHSNMQIIKTVCRGKTIFKEVLLQINFKKTMNIIIILLLLVIRIIIIT